MNIDIARAWKDEQYWESLSEKQRALVPENPLGVSYLTDGDLAGIYGAHADNGYTFSCRIDVRQFYIYYSNNGCNSYMCTNNIDSNNKNDYPAYPDGPSGGPDDPSGGFYPGPPESW